jgi:hypothetical protein
MRKLKGCCPYHFACASPPNKFHPEHDSQCGYKKQASDTVFYSKFRRCFTFQPYSYCFKCALPQSNSHNDEAPSCHAEVGYSREDKCPFSGFIFKTVFALWKVGYAEKLAGKHHLGERRIWENKEEFIEWVQVEDKQQGKYVNLLEIFIAFCKALEKARPDAFQ